MHRTQKTTENIHVSDGLRRIVTFLIIAPYKYSYLLTYLLIYEILVTGHSRSFKITPFDRSYTTTYQSAIASVALSCTVFE